MQLICVAWDFLGVLRKKIGAAKAFQIRRVWAYTAPENVYIYTFKVSKMPLPVFFLVVSFTHL